MNSIKALLEQCGINKPIDILNGNPDDIYVSHTKLLKNRIAANFLDRLDDTVITMQREIERRKIEYQTKKEINYKDILKIIIYGVK